MSDRQLSRPRLLAFSAACLVLALLAFEGAVTLLERTGRVSTHRPADQLHYVEGSLFRRVGDSWTNTDYAKDAMFQVEFAADRGDGWRAFVLGASFAEGTPWACCAPGQREQPGGMASYLRTQWELQYRDSPLEVVPMTTGGAASGRVAQVAEQVAALDPNLLLVATCNNEGALTRNTLTEELHRLGGYRFLRGLLAPPGEGASSYYTPQHVDAQAAARNFESNLREIADAAAAHEVPVLLATLPVNLRYVGFERGHSVEGDAGQYSRADIPEDFWEAMNDAERGSWDEAERGLQGIEPGFPEWYGLRGEIRMQRGDVEGGLADLRRFWGDCLGDFFELRAGGDLAAARDHLQGCPELSDVTRWMGVVEFELGNHDEARPWLEQSAELLPSNRCRPSFNHLIRQTAEAYPDVHLVDLEAAAERLSPGGLPGPELFVDYCHMTRYGYFAMAEEVRRRVDELGLGPRDRRPDGRALSWPEMVESLDLVDDSGGDTP